MSLYDAYNEVDDNMNGVLEYYEFEQLLKLLEIEYTEH
jgi:hypothetical protein